MRLTIVPSDKTIIIDQTAVTHIEQDMSWIPSNVRAVQWQDTHGHIEYNDGTLNQEIENLGIFENAITNFNDEIKRLEEKRIADEEAYEASRNYEEEFRQIRTGKLYESDWTQIRDVSLPNDEEWKIYRQLLRDLPENITDYKAMVLDPDHPDWPQEPT